MKKLDTTIIAVASAIILVGAYLIGAIHGASDTQAEQHQVLKMSEVKKDLKSGGLR